MSASRTFALGWRQKSRGQKPEVGGQKAKSIELIFVCGSFLPFSLFPAP